MAARKNNKGRIAGSGTVSHARKERYQKACAERDRLLALATTEEEKQKAKAIQKQQQKKPVVASGAAASSSSGEAAPCQKEQQQPQQAEGSAPCQKEQKKTWVEVASAPCQKEQKTKVEDAAPCQKEQKEKVEDAAPCQKEQKEKVEEKAAPCQKEQKEQAAPCQKEQQKVLGPSSKQQVEEQKRSQRISLTPPSSPSPKPKRKKQPCQKDATPQPNANKWVSDGSRWITKEEASKRVAIDWHNTLSKGNHERVHWQDRDALQLLQEKGYYLILLSYSGQERAEKTLKELQKQDLLQFFEKVRFTWKKCGQEGKAAYCKENSIPYLFDDCPEIINECWEMGYSYTYALHTRHYKHTAGHWHFWQAANQFLLDQGETA